VPPIEKILVRDVGKTDESNMQKLLRQFGEPGSSTEEQEPSKVLQAGREGETKSKKFTVSDLSNTLSKEGQGVLGDEQSPIISSSQHVSGKDEIYRESSPTWGFTDSEVQQLPVYSANADNTTSAKKPSWANEDLNPGWLRFGNVNIVEGKPAERVSEASEDMPFSQPQAKARDRASIIDIENTTTPVKLATEARPSGSDDGKAAKHASVDEHSGVRAAPKSKRPASPTATEDAAPKLGSSSSIEELAHLISKELLTAIPLAAKEQEEEELEGPLFAWISNFSGSFSADILPLTVSELDIERRMNRQGAAKHNLLTALSNLNTIQRRMILRHVEKHELTLCFVDTWAKEKVPTVFGDLEIALLVWVTTGYPQNQLPGGDTMNQTLPLHAQTAPQQNVSRGPPPPGPHPHQQPMPVQPGRPILQKPQHHLQQQQRQQFPQTHGPPPPPPLQNPSNIQTSAHGSSNIQTSAYGRAPPPPPPPGMPVYPMPGPFPGPMTVPIHGILNNNGPPPPPPPGIEIHTSQSQRRKRDEDTTYDRIPRPPPRRGVPVDSSSWDSESSTVSWERRRGPLRRREEEGVYEMVGSGHRRDRRSKGRRHGSGKRDTYGGRFDAIRY
jgi:hypothetical protein